MEWQEQAVEINKKNRPSMLSILEERGYIQTIAGYAYLKKRKRNNAFLKIQY